MICVQNDLYSWNPSSNRSSGRPEIGVGNVFRNQPNDQMRTWVEYWDLILVSSLGFPLSSINFSARHLVERRLTGKSGWYRQLFKTNVCFVPLSSMRLSLTVPFWRHDPVPFAVVKLLFVWWRDPGTNRQISLQMWPVVELSQTKKTESVSKCICVLSCSVSISTNEAVNPYSEWDRVEISPLDSGLEEHGWHVCVKSPLEENEHLKVASPSETPLPIFSSQELGISPSEGSEIGLWFVAKMLRHVMPVIIENIPMTVMKMRKAEMIPSVGLFGRPLRSSLVLDKKLKSNKNH